MKNESVNETRRESMSMHPQPIPTIPEETNRIAHAVLPTGNVWMQMRDELGTLYEDQDFQDLFTSRGQPAETPWRLALVTIMQYGEGLTDRQAALAVRTRIDWKYVLSLELTASGFDFSVLCEFRARLLAEASRTPPVRAVVGPVPPAWLEEAHEASNEPQDACAGGDAHASTARMRRRDDASCQECAVRGRAIVATGAQGSPVGRPL